MSVVSRANPRILLVDDEPLVRKVLHEFLSDSYQCMEAGSAEEALALLRTERFNLVLADINMNGISGLEMVPQVRAAAPETVVVMISGELTIERAIEAMRAGAFDYIMKPFDLRHVGTAVQRALDHHLLLEEKRCYEHHLEELVKQRTAELNHLSYHDIFTDLPNRLLFEDRLAQVLTHAHRSQQRLGILFVCIDQFNKIIDTLGHIVRDQLLRTVAQRLINCVGEDQTVARFEGDEFALLLTQIRGTEDLVEIANRIHDELKAPHALEALELFITASIGISLYPYDGEDAPTLIKNAGAALNRTKEQGGDGYQFYTADMAAKARQRLSLESDLRRALDREEFVVHYQPQIDISTRRIVGAEALVRWQHPELGLLPPAEFIPLAEDSGLIVPLGECVLKAACAQSKLWQEEGFAPLCMAVNLSPRQFRQPHLSQTVVQIMQETKLDPQYLELELTESFIMKNPNLAARALGELKEMGVSISIDDFGTGYSSLSCLNRLPIDKLKIDRSFIRDTTTDPDAAALVMAIITLAHNLRLKVLAEGVETEEQMKFLHLLKCDLAQGYLFSTPLPADAMRELLLAESRLTTPSRASSCLRRSA